MYVATLSQSSLFTHYLVDRCLCGVVSLSRSATRKLSSSQSDSSVDCSIVRVVRLALKSRYSEEQNTTIVVRQIIH